jgi:hypothetical protein
MLCLGLRARGLPVFTFPRWASGRARCRPPLAPAPPGREATRPLQSLVLSCPSSRRTDERNGDGERLGGRAALAADRVTSKRTPARVLPETSSELLDAEMPGSRAWESRRGAERVLARGGGTTCASWLRSDQEPGLPRLERRPARDSEVPARWQPRPRRMLPTSQEERAERNNFEPGS